MNEALKAQRILILEDDFHIGEALMMGLERENRTVVLCRDLASAQLVVEQMPLTHIVSDVKLSGPFRFEGLDFIHHVKRHAPKTSIIIMTGSPSPELQREATERGASAFLMKPFDLDELEATLDRVPSTALGNEQLSGETIRIPAIEEIIASPELYPHFQAIVGLDGDIATPYGFESLARFRTNSFLRRPDLLFEYASRTNQIADLEIACIEKALRYGRALTEQGMLFLNLHPAVFNQPERLVRAVLEACEKQQVAPDRLVLEITEQQSLGDRQTVLKSVRVLQSHGVQFAFDDVGVAYSHLTLIDDIRPNFLKISQHFGTSFERDETKLKIVKNILSLAKDFDCQLILEGIEDAETAARARELRISHGQGYFFGRPADATTYLPSTASLPVEL